jgi:uncharacterized protein YjiS (DUF1127 family)
MSDCTHETMTNDHAEAGLLGTIGGTLRVWRERQIARRELTQFTQRDLHDAGLSSTDVMYEASKPFWQA